MQISSSQVNSKLGEILASQTIDIHSTFPSPDSVVMRSTEREYRLAGQKNGIDTFTSLSDAIVAARTLSRGSMPGLAVLEFRGGFRIHDVHAFSRSYLSSSPHGNLPPITRELKRSSVPFSGGNLRQSNSSTPHAPAVVRSAKLAALVDGARVFIPDTYLKWAGRSVLTELR